MKPGHGTTVSRSTALAQVIRADFADEIAHPMGVDPAIPALLAQRITEVGR